MSQPQLGGSDHRPVLLTMDLEWKQKDEKTFPPWNHKKANWNLFSQLTNKYSKMIKTNHYNINQQVKKSRLYPEGSKRNYSSWSKEKL